MKFADAKVGDIVATPYRDGDVKRGVIARLTLTQVVVGGVRYRRDNGAAVGDRTGSITPWTPAHDEQVARYSAGMRLQAACRALESVACGWGVKMPKDHVAAIALAEAIEAYVKGAK